MSAPHAATLLILPVLLGLARAQVQWTPQVDFAPRTGHGMAFDTNRQRILVFGGGWGRADLWEFDGTAWTLRAPPVRPPGRANHAVAFDSNRGRLVAFGGYDPMLGDLDDTWEWDGATWLMRTPGLRPSPRRGARMVFDAARGRVVLFGGMIIQNYQGIYYGDTWEWDGAVWIQRTPSTAPANRAFHTMSYDPLRGRVVLFGGQNLASGNNSLNDTWEWDGTNWSQRVAPVAPLLRPGAAACFDTVSGRTLLLGLFQQPLFSLMQTWGFDGTSWTLVASGSPTPGSPVELAHDPIRGRTVVLAGESSGRPGATWEFAGSQWYQVLPAQSPVLRYAVIPSLVHDEARDVSIMVLNTGAVVDTWEHAGNAWTLRTGVGGPYITLAQSMAHDSARGITVLFGGQSPYGDDQTWEYNGNAWTQLLPSPRPPAFYGHAMAFDAARGRTVVFGTTSTSSVGDTWEWDGATWTHPAPVHMPWGRRFAAMIWHPVRQRILMYGGGEGQTTSSLFRDLWEWDGSDWTQLSASVPPGYRTQHQMVFDSARGRMVVYGGKDHFNVLRDTWEWDGANWIQRSAGSDPGPTMNLGMVYRPSSATTLLFGGFNYATWTYGPVFPAIATRFGAGCTGSAGVPVLSTGAGNLPWLGGRCRQVLTGVPAGSVALFELGLSNQSWFGLPLPFDFTPIGMTGCRQLSSTEVITAVPTGTGTTGYDIDFPNDPALLAARVYSQAFTLDLAANPFGGTLSNGLESRIGGR